MFNVSLGELGLVSIVALLVFGPKEFANAFKYIRYAVIKLKRIISFYLNPIQKEVHSIKDHLLDLDGEIQPIYDLEDIKRELKIVKDEKKARTTHKKNIRRTL